MDLLKTPPHSVEAENAVLGALLKDNASFDKIHTLKADDFYTYAGRIIYSEIVSMITNNMPADSLTVSEALDAKDLLEKVGGVFGVGDLVASSSGSGNIKRYAEIIKDKSLLRQLIKAANDIAEDAFDVGDTQKKIESAQQSIMAITEKTSTTDPVLISDLLPDRMDRYEQIFNGEVGTVTTGLKDLDQRLGGGFEKGRLVIIAARPAMGKSALAVQIAEAMQSKEKAALLFTCEMPNREVVDRIISFQAKIPSDRMRTGKFDNTDFDGMVASIPKINDMNFFIDDSAHTLTAITSKARSIKRKHGLSVVVVDYLQLLEGVGDIREQQISSISRGLKKLSIELDVTVIALSQLNRGLESRQNKRPMMSDLRESGAIEQDADIVIGIYRDEEYNPDSTEKGTAELLILKNRSGAKGRVRVTFLSEYTRFTDFVGSQHFEEPKQATRKGFSYAA